MKQTISSRRFTFNIIDILLIVVILAASAMLVYVLATDTPTSEQAQIQSVTLEYKIKVSSIREEFQGKAGIGDTLRDAESGTVLGEIVDISYSDSLYTGINKETGKPVVSPYPGFLSMTITVSTPAVVEDGFTRVGDYEMQTGRQVSFHLPGLAASGSLISMTATPVNPTPQAD